MKRFIWWIVPVVIAAVVLVAAGTAVCVLFCPPGGLLGLCEDYLLLFKMKIIK